VSELPAYAAELLYQSRVARLGTADRAGQPLVVPVCYAFDGRACFSAIDAKPKRVAARQLRRLRNIAENPRVSLTVDRYDEEWSRLCWVIVQGRADVLTEGSERAGAVDLLLSKYTQYRAMGLDRETATVIRISPERTLEVGELVADETRYRFSICRPACETSTPAWPACRIACASRCFSIHALISRSRWLSKNSAVIVIRCVTFP